MSTPAQREAQKRQEKLDAIEEQKSEGTLSVRKMTEEEKARFAPSKPLTEPRPPRRRRPPR